MLKFTKTLKLTYTNPPRQFRNVYHASRAIFIFISVFPGSWTRCGSIRFIECFHFLYCISHFVRIKSTNTNEVAEHVICLRWSDNNKNFFFSRYFRSLWCCLCRRHVNHLSRVQLSFRVKYHLKWNCIKFYWLSHTHNALAAVRCFS